MFALYDTTSYRNAIFLLTNPFKTKKKVKNKKYYLKVNKLEKN